MEDNLFIGRGERAKIVIEVRSLGDVIEKDGNGTKVLIKKP